MALDVDLDVIGAGNGDEPVQPEGIIAEPGRADVVLAEAAFEIGANRPEIIADIDVAGGRRVEADIGMAIGARVVDGPALVLPDVHAGARPEIDPPRLLGHAGRGQQHGKSPCRAQSQNLHVPPSWSEFGPGCLFPASRCRVSLGPRRINTEGSRGDQHENKGFDPNC
ncbi:hypothetical protein [Inquilinus limosus]|uniref:hypothetical protein n=1 Tax=Inquilinus limosus TaxID=171674 RepID=UPI001EE7607D|nr:hypothetical protein [Inquilinus limosus]